MGAFHHRLEAQLQLTDVHRGNQLAKINGVYFCVRNGISNLIHISQMFKRYPILVRLSFQNVFILYLASLVSNGV